MLYFSVYLVHPQRNKQRVWVELSPSSGPDWYCCAQPRQTCDAGSLTSVQYQADYRAAYQSSEMKYTPS